MPFMCACHFIFILLQVQFYNFNDLFYFFVYKNKLVYLCLALTHLSYTCANSSLTHTIQCRVGGLAYIILNLSALFYLLKAQRHYLSIWIVLVSCRFLDMSPVETDGTRAI